MDAVGPDDFAFGTKNRMVTSSANMLAIKMAPFACLLMAMLAADLKSQGKSLHQKNGGSSKSNMDAIKSRWLMFKWKASEGMSLMKRLMEAFRTRHPSNLAGSLSIKYATTSR